MSIFLLLSYLVVGGAFAAVHIYNGEGFYTKGDAVTFQGGREGLYKTKRAIGLNEPLPSGIRNGFSYINFEHLLFTRSNRSAAEDDPNVERHLEILVFELNDRYRIGHRVSPTVLRLCCDAELVNEGVCTTPGRVIIQPDKGSQGQGSRGADQVGGRRALRAHTKKSNKKSVAAISMDSPWISLVTFSTGSTEAIAPVSTWSPPKKGMYYLWFLSCEADRIDDLEVTGYTEWKNPHGYLPGMMAPYLPFYMSLSMLMILLSFWWFRSAVNHWRELTTIQMLISAVLGMTMVEFGLWYVDYHGFNRHGIRPYETTVWATTVGCVRKTVSRVLVLLVCMGYGVLRPVRGGLSPRVLVLALAYGYAVVALDLVTFVGAISDLTPATRMILIIPVAMLDTVFLVWMFSAVARVVNHLELRRKTLKLHLYRRFSWGLVLYASASFGFGIYELYSRFSDADNEHWETDWLVTGYWHFLTLAALAGCCVLWQPSKQALAYTYSEEFSPSQAAQIEEESEFEYLRSVERRAEQGQQLVTRNNAAVAARNATPSARSNGVGAYRFEGDGRTQPPNGEGRAPPPAIVVDRLAAEGIGGGRGSETHMHATNALPAVLSPQSTGKRVLVFEAAPS